MSNDHEKPGRGPKEESVQVKHLGELETANFKVPDTSTLQAIWDEAYVELEVARQELDVFQAVVRGQPVDLMSHLSLTLAAAQAQDLCDKRFEIVARTGGA